MKWLKTWKSKIEKTKGTTQKSWIAIQRGNWACRFGKVSSYLLYSLHRLAVLWRIWMPRESCCSGPWWLLEDHQTWNAVGRHPLPMSMRVFPASWAAWPKRSDIDSKDLPTMEYWIDRDDLLSEEKNRKHNFESTSLWWRKKLLIAGLHLKGFEACVPLPFLPISPPSHDHFPL